MSACEREGHTYDAWMNSFTLERTEGFSCVYIIYVKISPSKVLYEFKFEIACSTEGSRSAIEGTYDESGRCISGADNPHKVEPRMVALRYP